MMGDIDNATPSPKKRKRSAKDTPASNEGGNVRKRSNGNPNEEHSRATTTPSKSTRPTQRNAEAGPSTQRMPAVSNSVTSTRTSTRISKPTMRKMASMATKKMPISTKDDTDSDSDRTPPPGIIISPKKRILPPKQVGVAKSRPTLKPKVVHLGAFEISSSSENDTQLRKKSKISKTSAASLEIINLCSDQDIPLKAPLKKPGYPRNDDVVVIESSDDESGQTCALANTPIPTSANPSHITLSYAFETGATEVSAPTMGVMEPHIVEQPSSANTIETMDLTPNLASGEHIKSSETAVDALQTSFREAMLESRPFSRNRSREFSGSVSIRPRAIVYGDTVTTPNFHHTPVYFSRIGSVKKKAKRTKRATAISVTPNLSRTVPGLTSKSATAIANTHVQEDSIMEDINDLNSQPPLVEPAVVPVSDNPSLDRTESMAMPPEIANRSVVSIIHSAILDIPHTTPGSPSMIVNARGSRNPSQADLPNTSYTPDTSSADDHEGTHQHQSLKECLENGGPPRIGHVEAYPESLNQGVVQTAGTSVIENLAIVQPDENVKSQNLVKLLHGVMQSKKPGTCADASHPPVENKHDSPVDSAQEHSRLPQAVDPILRDNHDNADQPSICAEAAEAPEAETSSIGITADRVLPCSMVVDEEVTDSYSSSLPNNAISLDSLFTPTTTQMDTGGPNPDPVSSSSPAALEESFVEMEITKIDSTSLTASENVIPALKESEAPSRSTSATLSDSHIITNTTTTTTTTTMTTTNLQSSLNKPASPTQRTAEPIIQAASQRLLIDLSFLGQNIPVLDISSLMENLNYDDEDDLDLSELELLYPE
ncbi:hypothetical protein CVT25_011358 [Psilocybe cyanescens]|uniref:Uncharacterized protein n=1 Tax=Psilocybe cyanescens TaxID=93625 RepID=A0A409WG47_PSICY|nr:hypothetical protein CVT25_011358 [Psilocybe cyanescens]